MGSVLPQLAGVAPQQALPAPLATRRAACPYFSFTISVMSGVLMLSPELNDFFGFDCLVSGTTLGIQKRQKLLQGGRIGGVSQERAGALDVHQVFVFELLDRKSTRLNSSH